MMETAPEIVLVDDDASIRGALAAYLTRNGYAVRAVADARALDDALAQRRPDLVILDLMLPGEDGLSICRRLQPTAVPIVILSALGDTMDRIIGLELGAADYLAKPFEPRELLARIRAVLRRQAPTGAAADRRRRINGWTFDPHERRMTDGDSTITLTRGEARLLAALAEAPRRLQTRQMLLDAMHGDEAAGPFDRAVDLAVSRLRRKLAAIDGVHIEALRGDGYRLVADVDTP
jgi:two-component system OmpR family response regulator